uniref:Heme NO-binding domain-containing protein n=1 Tax=Timema cristinae TaxID=61476 RepID=A0A7R9CZH9_TIMCR|nr:unnamed protein product [Timema cristinae]
MRWPDLLLVTLGVTEHEFFDQMGVYFVGFVGQYGYDRVLSVLGRHMRDFLNGLDNLHEYLKFSYPRMRAPSFICENETRHGLTLHYRSKRRGFVYYTMGQIREHHQLSEKTATHILEVPVLPIPAVHNTVPVQTDSRVPPPLRGCVQSACCLSSPIKGASNVMLAITTTFVEVVKHHLEKCGGNCVVFNRTEWQEMGNYKSIISKIFSNMQPPQKISLTNNEIYLRRICVTLWSSSAINKTLNINGSLIYHLDCYVFGRFGTSSTLPLTVEIFG